MRRVLSNCGLNGLKIITKFPFGSWCLCTTDGFSVVITTERNVIRTLHPNARYPDTRKHVFGWALSQKNRSMCWSSCTCASITQSKPEKKNNPHDLLLSVGLCGRAPPMFQRRESDTRNGVCAIQVDQPQMGSITNSERSCWPTMECFVDEARVRTYPLGCNFCYNSVFRDEKSPLLGCTFVFDLIKP